MHSPSSGQWWVTQPPSHIPASAFSEHSWHQLLKFILPGKQTLRQILAYRMLGSALGIKSYKQEGRSKTSQMEKPIWGTALIEASAYPLGFSEDGIIP